MTTASPKSSALLGAADIENVRRLRDEGERQIVFRRGEAVPQPRAVQEKKHAIFIANPAQGGKFRTGIDGAQLRGVGNVHGARHDHMFKRCVGIMRPAERFHRLRTQFSVFVGNAQYFMAAGLDGAGFMHGDMAGIRRNHALPGAGNAAESTVRLACVPPIRKCTSTSGLWHRLANDFRRLAAIFVLAVPGRLHKVRLLQALQDARVRAFAIVAVEAYQVHLRLSERKSMERLLFYHS